MPCSCQTAARAAGNTGAENSVAAISTNRFPHEILPGESCIYCAHKHLSIAYATAVTGGSGYVVAGELELARRHLRAEYPELLSAVSEVLYLRMTGEAALARMQDALKICSRLVENEPTDAGNDAAETEEEPGNVLLGALHLYAACRLAFEVGYTEPNRSMIVGDLALAREGLAHLTADAGAITRELRHRIQKATYTDLSEVWTKACSYIHNMIKEHRDDIVSKCSEGLKAYLGLDKTV